MARVRCLRCFLVALLAAGALWDLAAKGLGIRTMCFSQVHLWFGSQLSLVVKSCYINPHSDTIWIPVLLGKPRLYVFCLLESLEKDEFTNKPSFGISSKSRISLPNQPRDWTFSSLPECLEVPRFTSHSHTSLSLEIWGTTNRFMQNSSLNKFHFWIRSLLTWCKQKHIPTYPYHSKWIQSLCPKYPKHIQYPKLQGDSAGSWPKIPNIQHVFSHILHKIVQRHPKDIHKIQYSISQTYPEIPKDTVDGCDILVDVLFIRVYPIKIFIYQ